MRAIENLNSFKEKVQKDIKIEIVEQIKAEFNQLIP
jgi:hypothetical protein